MTSSLIRSSFCLYHMPFPGFLKVNSPTCLMGEFDLDFFYIIQFILVSTFIVLLLLLTYYLYNYVYVHIAFMITFDYLHGYITDFLLLFIVHSPLLVFKRYFLLVVYLLSFEIILEKVVIFLEKSWNFFMEIVWPPCSGHCLYMNTNIQEDFQICINVPLKGNSK